MPKRRANGEGSIYKRKDGTWTGQYTDHAGKKRYLYGKTQPIVREKLKEAIQKSDKGILHEASQITVEEWLSQWLEVYNKPIVRSSSYGHNYVDLMKHIAPTFPGVLLKDLRTDMLQKLFNEKAISGKLRKVKDTRTGKKESEPGGLSPATLGRIKSTLRACLNQTVENGLLERNVAEKVKLPKDTSKELVILTVEEQQKLQKTVLETGDSLALGIIIALFTGVRVGELLAIQIGDIDFKNKELHIRRTIRRTWKPDVTEQRSEIIVGEPKTEKSKRTIPLPDFIVDIFRQMVDYRNNLVEQSKGYWNSRGKHYSRRKWVEDGYIFLSPVGAVVEHTSYNDLFRKYLDAAGLPRINFHALRHTFATRGLEAGVDIKTLSEILGHSDAKMTLNTYVHALKEQKRCNMEKLSAYFIQEETDED